MLSVFIKEINAFFSSLIAYMVVAVFLLMTGLFMWVFSDTSVLNYNFAELDQLFAIAPLVFLFLIPAVTMRSFAEEKQKGTIELLFTKPLSTLDILLGKYLAAVTLVLFSLLPTALYYYSIYTLGSPPGNLDTGAIMGSYIGLVLLAGVFVSIGILASALTDNQIVAFILSAFLCFFFHWAFAYIAAAPIFTAKYDLLIQKAGISYHYASISKGVIDTRDLVYFVSMIAFFLYTTHIILERKK